MKWIENENDVLNEMCEKKTRKKTMPIDGETNKWANFSTKITVKFKCRKKTTVKFTHHTAFHYTQTFKDVWNVVVVVCVYVFGGRYS